MTPYFLNTTLVPDIIEKFGAKVFGPGRGAFRSWKVRTNSTGSS
jgi:hypothetical protein